MKIYIFEYNINGCLYICVKNGEFMKKVEFAKLIIKENGGIAKTAQLNKEGIQNSEIKKMCKNGELERVRHGYYKAICQEDILEETMIATFLKEGVVCMESALFHYGYSDKMPLTWSLAVSRNISRSKTKIDNFFCKFYFVQEDKLSLGKTTGMFNGIELPVYDRERTICDCFKYRTKMDNEMFNKAINAYVADEKKNLGNLSKYANEMRVYKKITELMEIMLNG